MLHGTRYIIVILPLQVIEGKLRHAGSQQVQFCSFSQDNDSVLKREEGRQRLREVGISTPETVGAWLVEVVPEGLWPGAAGRQAGAIHTQQHQESCLAL